MYTIRELYAVWFTSGNNSEGHKNGHVTYDRSGLNGRDRGGARLSLNPAVRLAANAIGQAIVGMIPPHTRIAAPFVTAASGLAIRLASIADARLTMHARRFVRQLGVVLRTSQDLTPVRGYLLAVRDHLEHGCGY